MHGEILKLRDLATVALCSLLFLAPAAWAADEAAATGETPELKERCLGCHDDPELKDDAGKSYALSATDYKASAHRGVDCGECHTDALTIKHPRKGNLGPVSPETCIGCHEDEFKAVGASIHGKEGDNSKKACINCHGNLHLTLKASKPESAVAPQNQMRSCGNCHEKVTEGYLSSVHARALLVAGLNGAPACSTCHTAHDVQPKSNPEANNSRQKTPDTCAKCHEGILRLWDESKHGELWRNGDPKGPTCVTCHDAHAIKRPTGIDVRAHMPSDCGNCHKEVYKSFHDSFHGKATSLGREAAAMCSDCHTPHHNLPASDPKSSIHKDNLAKTCGKCHENVNAGFLTFDPHANPSDPKRNIYVYWVWVFMTGLLLGVFAFFGIHDVLWLQRALVGRLRGEFKVSHGGPGPYVRRFSVTQKWIHVSIIVSFLLLAATGLPLKFAAATWAPGVMAALGGPATAGWLHRVAAVITFGYFGFHLLNMLYDMIVRKEKGYLWGPRSMVPQLKDITDIWANLKYFLYLGPRPKLDRWAYWEKFDYLAVFWGVAIIGFSGLMLWFPTFFTQFVPGWVLNAAYVTHSDEALLATGFIFLFHFFHTHLRPEAFPMDPVIFTGRMTLERFKEERPLEYERAVKEGRLESMMALPPTGEDITRAYVFGFLAVAIGIALAVGIFIALANGLLH